VIFQDFPGPGIFKKKNPGLSRRHGNPGEVNNRLDSIRLSIGKKFESYILNHNVLHSEWQDHTCLICRHTLITGDRCYDTSGGWYRLRARNLRQTRVGRSFSTPVDIFALSRRTAGARPRCSCTSAGVTAAHFAVTTWHGQPPMLSCNSIVSSSSVWGLWKVKTTAHTPRHQVQNSSWDIFTPF